MSTLTEPAAPTDRTSRSWLRAIDDIANGIRERELWGHLGWQDIKQRYRRSVIGPLWITVSMAITAVGLGPLYAVLFDQNVPTFLPDNRCSQLPMGQGAVQQDRFGERHFSELHMPESSRARDNALSGS